MHHRLSRVRFAATRVALVVATLVTTTAIAGETQLVSVATSGEQADFESEDAVMSANGRFVAFSTRAKLADAAGAGFRNLYVRDRKKGRTALISVTPSGAFAFAETPSISANGRFVAFASFSSRILVEGDGDRGEDIYLHDRKKGKTVRVSRELNGPPAQSPEWSALLPSISGNGRFIAFVSDSDALVENDDNDMFDVFLYDIRKGTTTLVSRGVDGTGANDDACSEIGNRCAPPSLSKNGRFVVFISDASNLVEGDTNGTADVFLFDRKTETTSRVSVGVGGEESNGRSFVARISANGRFVAFGSVATNLVLDDTNGTRDIFVRDLKKGTTTIVSVASSGEQSDRLSRLPSISANGRFIAFSSFAGNLVDGDTQSGVEVYVHDRKKGRTTKVSVDASGADGDLPSDRASISANGRFVSFESSATNLVEGDANGETDIFVRDRK